MQTKRKSNIGLIKPVKPSVKFGSSFIKDYDASTGNFCALYDMLHERNVSFEVVSGNKLGKFDIVFSPGFSNISEKALVKYVKSGGVLVGLGDQKFESNLMRELFGLEIKQANMIQNEIGNVLTNSNFMETPQEFSLQVHQKIHPFIALALARKNALASTADIDYIITNKYGKGRTFYLYDLGFSLFSRYAENSHIQPKNQNIINKGFDDLEPLTWLLVKDIIKNVSGAIVYSSISPKIKSFSVAHDTESTDCLESGHRISILNKKYNISPTFYLRTRDDFDTYDGKPFLYAKPFILNKVDYSVEKAISYLPGQVFGLHSNQYAWVKDRKNSSLDIGKAYSNAASQIRQKSGQKVRSGSMHFGNYTEKSEDYKGISAADIALWRNSYKDNGITPFRPYLMFTENLSPLKVRGFVNNIKDDFVTVDIMNEKILKKVNKNLFWLDKIGQGNVFLHSHPHNFDDVKDGMQNYENLYRYLSTKLANVNDEEIIDYILEKQTQKIECSVDKKKIKINLSEKPSKLLLILESKTKKELVVTHKNKKLEFFTRQLDGQLVVSFFPIIESKSVSDYSISFKPISFRKTKVMIRSLLYKIKQIPGKINSTF